MLTELLVVVAVLGILMLAAVPWLMTYLPSATVSSGAREVHSVVSRAKMLAVTTRQSICVEVVAGGIRFRQGSCAGTVWAGTGTTSTGIFRFSNSVSVSNAGTSPIFTQFGTASQIGSISVTGTTGLTRTVAVALSGRVTIQ
jgi:Tfp pilus assembly protein FimT